MRLQLERIDVNHDLTIFAAVRRRNGRAGNISDLVSDLILQVIVKLSFVQAFPLDGKQAHRKIRRVGFQHDRRKRSFREAAQIGHGQVRNLSHVRIGIRTWLEVNLDQAHAGHRARLHVIDAAAQCKKTFEGIGHVGFDLFGRHPVIESRYQYHGNIDRREHVHGHLNQGW